jgi:hypothetical protein
VWLEAVEVPDNAADEAESFLRVAADSLSRQIRIGNENGLTYYSIRENGSNVVYLDLPYNPSAHRWWRIREGGGMIHWEVSPDGLMWTQLNAAITPSWVDSIEINIGAGTYGTENVPGDFAFDNVNAPP